MVEKISEARVSALTNIDLVTDERTLREQVDKKKKQEKNRGNDVPDSLSTQALLARLMTAQVIGGGGDATELTAAKSLATLLVDPDTHPMMSDKGDTLRQLVVQALSRQQAVMQGSSVQNATIQKINEQNLSEQIKTGGEGLKSALVGASTDPMASDKSQAAGAMLLSSRRIARHQVSATTITSSAQEKAVRMQEVKLPHPDNMSQALTLTPAHSEERHPTQIEVKTPLPGNMAQMLTLTPSHSKEHQSPQILTQQLKAQASVALPAAQSGAESQTLEVNYAFQRWSGDHSVKISVPAQVSRDTSITLLPSDPRASEALSRQMGHLTGLMADLLPPQREREEQQQKQQQQQQQPQDEDQE
ncbi:hypothetical protein SR89_17750 [Klebsiella aerogenes]|uniref:SpaN/EivJ family type III secretion system needle length determinant n=1 Tax=Klebsiella aerogenes TaxID=548 RepID=UPI0005EEE5BE|nr:hypothetical protein [Klebsiella aerogenes]KJO55863.1 hypothetical protein SR89_17750 [Klebsiella aerogenes]